MMIRLVGVGAALVAAMAGPAGLAHGATASPSQSGSASPAGRTCQNDFYATGVRIHTHPTVSSTVVGQGNPGDCVAKLAVAGGDTVRCSDGESRADWYDIKDSRTGVVGWVSGCYVAFFD
jgi:hypothetical protein